MHNLWERSQWDPKETCGNLSAIKRRKDNVFRRLSGELEDLDKERVNRHSPCYSCWTSNQNIRYAISNADPSTVEEVSCKENEQEREKCLKKHFSGKIELFFKPKQEIVYSCALYIQDIRNGAAAPKMDETEAPPIEQEILRVARYIRDDMKNTNGIELRPLDISMETVKKTIPKQLNLLI